MALNGLIQKEFLRLGNTYDGHELTAMYELIMQEHLQLLLQVYTLSCLKLKGKISAIRKTHFQLRRNG
jgi:hypothetical protein